MKTNDNSQKAQNFKRISENRVNKILVLFEQLKNLTNHSFYEYSNNDINKIFSLLKKELEKTENILLDANDPNKKKRFKL
jgi:hypothetical protein